MFQQTVMPAEPFWGWLVAFNRGTWVVTIKGIIQTFHGPGLSPPMQGPEKVKTDSGKLGLYDRGDRMIWFPEGSWFLAAYCQFVTLPAPVSADIMTASMAREMAQQQLQINALPTCLTPSGPANFDLAWADFLKLKDYVPEEMPEDVGTDMPAALPGEEEP